MVRRLTKFALLAPLCCGSLMGCDLTTGTIEYRFLYPDIPENILHCADAPAIPPGVQTDVQLGALLVDAIDAHADCRDRLAAVWSIKSKWPTNKPAD